MQGWFLREIEPHRDQLQRWVAARFPAIRDGEDLVQEACLRVWRRQLRQPLAHPKAFLFRVAHHLAVDTVRHEHASPIVISTEDASLVVVDDTVHVAEAACRRQEVELLQRAIDTLPNRCREIFVLRKLAGLSQKAIARKLHLSVLTVQAQASRGLRRCKRLLEDERHRDHAA